ncbi:SAM-dependent methyltransferase [Streptomyces sp. NPDC050161]|uniref:SAM-dependent methyltransferase n=1 Tax=Streptomyces sp. NPDC050161 TaxID=3365604 RepID=UPI0037905504
MDVSTPSVARMYDYLIGGTDNFSCDRKACAELLRIAPSTRELALINRAFLLRAVRYLTAECGIRQFIDHGSGLPTRPNVHQVAQDIAPDARVVYLDNDPMVLAHGRMMLQENLATTAVVDADLRDTDKIFENPEVRRLIRCDQPVAALFVSVLHCVPDRDDPWRLLRDVADRLPSGSYLVITQLASDNAALRREATEFMHRTTGGRWGRVRSFAEVDRYFDGLEPAECTAPVDVSQWHPDTDLSPRQATREWIGYGGVARVG